MGTLPAYAISQPAGAPGAAAGSAPYNGGYAAAPGTTMLTAGYTGTHASSTAASAAPYGQQPTGLSEFHSGLGNCCAAPCCVFCMGFFCPCILYGDTYARLHGVGFCSQCLLYSFCGWAACLFASTTRRTLRIKYAIVEKPCSDCCVHCWCSWCAVCQVRHRWGGELSAWVLRASTSQVRQNLMHIARRAGRVTGLHACTSTALHLASFNAPPHKQSAPQTKGGRSMRARAMYTWPILDLASVPSPLLVTVLSRACAAARCRRRGS